MPGNGTVERQGIGGGGLSLIEENELFVIFFPSGERVSQVARECIVFLRPYIRRDSVRTMATAQTNHKR
jgi:hypothetical protein